MTSPLERAVGWYRLHRENLVDAALLLLALQLPAWATGVNAPAAAAQAGVLVAFAVLSSNRVIENLGLWRRYLKLLPAYVGIAAAGSALFVFWLEKSTVHGWFAPLWIGLTVVSRLPFGRFARGIVVPFAHATIHFLQSRIVGPVHQYRGDVLVGDIAILGLVAWAASRWSGHIRPGWIGVGLISAAWIILHAIFRWHMTKHPRVPRFFTVGTFALMWGLLWPDAGIVAAIAFGCWLGLALLGYRQAVQRWASTPDTGPAEVWRWIGLLACTIYLFHPFIQAGLHGSGDARYYATFLVDALIQFRAGIFPVVVGQSEFQFNGSVMPIRIAPAFQYAGGALDLLTARTLEPAAVQNMLIVTTAFAGVFSAYISLRWVGANAKVAWFLSALYLGCPGTMGLAFNTDLYMSWLAVPLVPVTLSLCLRTFSEGGTRHVVALGLALGVTWWMHTPIAIWLTGLAAALQVPRILLQRPPMIATIRECAAGTIAFSAVASYPVVSTTLYPVDPALSAAGSIIVEARHVVQQLRETFPSAWLPLSSQGRRLGDFQLGYGLLLVGGLAWAGAWSSRVLERRLLLVLAVGILLLLIPIPLINQALWALIPGFIRAVTNIWVMQRLYVLLAALAVFSAALAWKHQGPSKRILIVLCLALAWSLVESTKFLKGSRAALNAASTTPTALRPENFILTRYSYGMFSGQPRYFSHGFTDPNLENRLLAEDLVTVLRSNLRDAEHDSANREAQTRVLTLIDGELQLSQHLTLVPGKRYLLTIAPPDRARVFGTFVLEGRTLNRIYGLPDYGGADSFGLGGSRYPFTPLFTSSSESENFNVMFIPIAAEDRAALASRFNLRLVEYDPGQLSVRVKSWLPYTASVQSDQPAWLETPRMHQAGYVATVNGQRVEVRRSSEHLTSFPVPAGQSQVELRYVAPTGLLISFWLSFATIVAGMIMALRAAIKALRPITYRG